MPDIVALAEAWLWGQFVGAVAEADDGVVTFEYHPEFAAGGLEISPLMLPLSSRGPVTFPDLRRLAAFEGLPGVLADALPDRFGNAVIRRFYADRGRPGFAMRPVQKLLYVGDRAMGALEFRPPERVPRPAERESLAVARLVDQARVVVEGRPDVAIPEMLRVGASAGGARPKALVLWNAQDGKLRSGFAPPRDRDEHWILKFDGVGEFGAPDADPKPYNRIEYTYAQLARDAGIAMPDTVLLEDGAFGHLLVRRFDRVAGQRRHLHSLGGMHHVDYNLPGVFSYEEFMRTVLTLQLGYPTLEEAFRRVVFNVVAVNQDDHVKNLSFLMDERGAWSLAPAYDLTFARGQGYTRSHQMTLGGKRDGFVRDDLVALGDMMGINHHGTHVIQQVVDAMDAWPRYARQHGVPDDHIALIGSAFRRT